MVVLWFTWLCFSGCKMRERIKWLPRDFTLPIWIFPGEEGAGHVQVSESKHPSSEFIGKSGARVLQIPGAACGSLLDCQERPSRHQLNSPHRFSAAYFKTLRNLPISKGSQSFTQSLRLIIEVEWATSVSSPSLTGLHWAIFPTLSRVNVRMASGFDWQIFGVYFRMLTLQC